MDLLGRRGDFRFSGGSWWWILKLAYDYGWKPKGTRPSQITTDCDVKEWDGSYFFNMFQEVDAADAKNIARALEKVIKDIPDKPNRKAHWLARHDKDEKVTPFEYWSGKVRKRYIKAFIKFCKAGAFNIG